MNKLSRPKEADGLVEAFEGTDNIQLGAKLNVYLYSPDTKLHSFETNHGSLIHLLEVDFINSLADIVNLMSKILGRKVRLQKVKTPLERFEESEPYKAADFYTIPKDADKLIRYAHAGGITAPFYFTFLSLGEPNDRINLLA